MMKFSFILNQACSDLEKLTYLSENPDTYLQGGSKIRISSPLASTSNTSAVGDISPLAILPIVDLDIPVIFDT